MKYLILFFISANLGATCSPKNEGITCINRPCINHIATVSKGTIVVGTCNKVYIKVKNHWVYDHTSIMTTGQIRDVLFTFENKIYDIGNE